MRRLADSIVARPVLDSTSSEKMLLLVRWVVQPQARMDEFLSGIIAGIKPGIDGFRHALGSLPKRYDRLDLWENQNHFLEE